MWWASRYRWMTHREKLVSLGFPALGTVAQTMSVPELPCKDVKRAAGISGNSMHFSTVAVVQLVALASFKKLD